LAASTGRLPALDIDFAQGAAAQLLPDDEESRPLPAAVQWLLLGVMLAVAVAFVVVMIRGM
jgi:hypothetical protein